MKIYNYDDNGKYIGECVADESPLEKGVYMIPANATDKQPLTQKYGFDIIWNSSKWVYKEQLKIKPEQPNEYSVWDEKAWTWIEDTILKTKYDDTIAKNAKAEALSTIIVKTSAGNTFNGDETARTNMMSAIMVADVVGKTSSPWKLADNTSKEITIDELKEALALSTQRVGEIVLS